MSTVSVRSCLLGFVALTWMSQAGVQAQAPGTDLYRAPLAVDTSSGALRAGPATPLASEPGYDNQPYFVSGSRLLFSSERAGDQTDIFALDLVTGETTQLTDTGESEFSPTPLPDGSGFSVVRVEEDGTQRLWAFDSAGREPRLLLPEVRGIGYHAWIDSGEVLLFVLGQPFTLHRVRLDAGRLGEPVASGIGRALHARPGSDVTASFVAPRSSSAERWVHVLDAKSGQARPFAPAFAGDKTGAEHDLAWTPDGTLLMSSGPVVAAWDPSRQSWQTVGDFSAQGLAAVSRMAVSPDGETLVFVAQDHPLSAEEVEKRRDQAYASIALAAAARDKGEFAEARRILARASRWIPPQAGVVRRLAGAEARDGRVTRSLARLETLVTWRTAAPIDNDPDLAAVRELPGYASLAERLANSTAPAVRAEVAFSTGTADFVPEGIAHDPSTGRFFLSSVRHGRIDVIAPTGGDEEGTFGAAAPFASLREAGFGGSVLGIATDPRRRLLWAVVAGLPHAAGGDTTVHGRTAVCSVDLGTGGRRRCWAPPSGSGRHALNDLTVAADGTVYVSDPPARTIWRLAPVAPEPRALESWMGPTGLRAPGGLALSADGSALWIADYGLGLLRVDVETRQLTPLATPQASLVGIDGLVRWRTSLLAIQNGIVPPRILKIDLASGGTSITGVETLEIARADWDEPTLGAVAGGDFYYIANSHWPRFAEDGSLPNADTLTPPLVLRLRLGR